jgi:N-acetylmuramoyl-L-alanine amidase
LLTARAPTAVSAAAPPPSAPVARLKKTAASPTPLLVVIDPGHGGKDPGAIGGKGLQEKEVVLDIGHRLRKLLEQQGHRVLMTRRGDTFISLDDRARIANREAADLYISIHANSNPKRNVEGVEIYLLGRATDAAARETAARENGGDEVQLNDLEQIFNDMALDYRINHSISLAHQTRDAFVRTVGKRYRVVDLGVKRAPFYVLMKSSMPSILAEVSFISNPQEEARLRQRAYRQHVAEALYEGIRRYLASAAILS